MSHQQGKNIAMMQSSYVGIDNILRCIYLDELHELPGNIIKIGNTCQKFNNDKLFISAILLTSRTTVNII